MSKGSIKAFEEFVKQTSDSVQGCFKVANLCGSRLHRRGRKRVLAQNSTLKQPWIQSFKSHRVISP